MILVNSQLKENKECKTHMENFPRLYYQNFSGEWRQISHISVKIIDGNIDVQTDLSDTNVIYEYITEWIEKEKSIAEQKIHDAQNILQIINEVSENKVECF